MGEGLNRGQVWGGTVTNGRDDPSVRALENRGQVGYIGTLVMCSNDGMPCFLLSEQVNKNLVTRALKNSLAHDVRQASVRPARCVLTIDMREISFDAGCKIGSAVLKRTAMRLAFFCQLPVVKVVLQD